MSETDDLEEIKAQKKTELLNDGDSDATAQAPDEPIHVDGEQHYQSVREEYDVVLVDFYADWCGPCKMLEPVVEELATETDAAVAKVDVDAHQELAAQYGVRGVPTVVVLAESEVVEQVVGVRDKSHYAALIEQAGA